jgi:hypothetical protein
LRQNVVSELVEDSETLIVDSTLLSVLHPRQVNQPGGFDPPEDCSEGFDGLFGARAQRRGLRRYLEGLLSPAKHNSRGQKRCLTGSSGNERLLFMLPTDHAQLTTGKRPRAPLA